MALLRFIGRSGANRGVCRLAPVVVALLMLCSGAPLSAAPRQPTQEYQVKAVFLFNFAQFVDWPPDAFSGSASPLVIGVIGEDPFGSALDEAVREENIRGRSLVTRRFRRAEEIDACHILFISRSESARLEEIIAALNRRSILTVSDTGGAAERGVMICFFTDNNRLRLRINVTASRAAGLAISSKLLRPAEIVGNVEPSP